MIELNNINTDISEKSNKKAIRAVVLKKKN